MGRQIVQDRCVHYGSRPLSAREDGAARPNLLENCYDPGCIMNVTPPALSRVLLLTFRTSLAAMLVVVAVGLTVAAPAHGQEMAAFLSMELEIERQLLADDLRLYAEARQRQITERESVEELLVEVDQQFETGTVTLGELEDRERQIVLAEQTLAATSRETERLRLRIYDRLRRTGLLEQALEAHDGPGLLPDPLSGRWRLDLDPGNVEGVLTLRLDGTVVRGSYAIEDGGTGGSLQPGTLPPSSGAFVDSAADEPSRGSLRGTYTGGLLRLERIDALRGLHSTFQGTLDPVRRQLLGTWTAVDLTSGGPGGGDWTADKIESEEDEEEDTP